MRRKIIWGIVALVGLLAVALGISLYCSANVLTVSFYEVGADVTQPLRIVQLSDLHSHVFGEDNTKLVQLVAQQEPDLIFMTGDMLSSSDAGSDVICRLIPQLTSIAPVYWSDGNHEKSWMRATGTDLHTSLSEAGAIVLDNAFSDVSVKGQALRIGGYYGYYRCPHLTTQDPAEQKLQTDFAEEFEQTERLKLLLCHIPTAWADWEYINRYPVDVVFCGHYHGGQVRLPLIGGLYAPYVGWFPQYTRGVFEGSEAVCVLSAGLGTDPGIPRVNNLPEIVVVDLIPQ